MINANTQRGGKRKTTHVMKFGGSSLSGSDQILHCVSIVKEYREREPNSLVIICSALGETTDELLKAVNLAKASDFEKAKRVLEEIKKAHARVVAETIRNPSLEKEASDFVDNSFGELDRALYGISLLKDVSARSLDYVLSFGERVSTFIMNCLLASNGLKTRYLTGGEAGIVTDDSFGSAEPIIKTTEENLRKKLLPLLDQGVTPIVTGFIAETLQGHDVTTLGRGGSDYTASLIASAIEADEVFLWTDVDGLLTADPRLVKDARIVKQVTYLEAMEMSAFGAKSMQPRALEPVARKEIPVRIKNTFKPSSEGTLIVSPRRIRNGTHFGVKSIGSLTDVAIVSISGASIVGQPGTALTIFEILKELGVGILAVSQSLSESNVSFVIRKEGLQRVMHALSQRLLHIEEQGDRRYGEGVGTSHVTSLASEKGSIFAKVECEDDVAVVGVLGRGMIGTPGIAGRVFTAVAREGINIRMIAQGSSEINISFVIKDKDRSKAVIALHKEFCLEQAANNLEDIEKPTPISRMQKEGSF
jgi:aspartate kinase